ncbi:serine hydrolase [Nocardia stercoris]|nr:serine hydrolase [Nocardia stercoris]
MIAASTYSAQAGVAETGELRTGDPAGAIDGQPAAAAAGPQPGVTTTTIAGGPIGTSALEAEFAALQSELGGSMGLALMPVNGTQVITFGSWTDGNALSTIKVPLALAALRRQPTELADTAAAAITASDNDAAQALWQSLGTGDEAADAVEAVLREAGDTTTDVADRHDPNTTVRVDDPLSFGSTDWTLVNQVRFAAHLPCLPQANLVTSLMSQVTASQSWGLGAFDGAAFKGGWAPDDSTGYYTVRQFGIIPTPSGHLAVAMAAQPTSGSYDDATAMLDRLTAVLGRHLGETSGGDCHA